MLNKKIIFLLVAIAMTGCATIKSNNAPTDAKPSAEADKQQAVKKLAFAIGREVGDFTISAQQEGEAPGGYNRTDYKIKTNDGTSYQCYILEPSGLGKVMTWGMASGTDAVCSEISSSSNNSAKPLEKNCNALQRAAKKC
jgi:hypothetical protein